ncbi:hypothetical protein BH747_05025 [Enterococcus villorum]|uniref:Uncharacterized protein n=2 Tax=Enterococcus villorum TaxID=112904 RepID=A0A1V8YDQ6_9ENTE|nr:hypothetical protein [Enterococcus villorum]OQO70765.1 hypothetical protein BH747_05025 [Enterococcus villorum]OQO75072.1 hypothetical protein BH744_05550 [Enterococcus villorum]
MKRNAFIKLLMSFILFIWLALGSFSFILNKTITANVQTKRNQETFIKEVNQTIPNYSLGANLPKNVLDSVITETEIQAGPKKVDYLTLKKRMIEKINQYVESTTSEVTEKDKENINKVADELINKIKGEINTSFLFFSQTLETIVPIATTFTLIMLINATITIILLLVLFRKTIFNELCYSFWGTAILLVSASIILGLIPFDQLALSSQTNRAVLKDIAGYASNLTLMMGMSYVVLGSILSYFGNKNKLVKISE